MSDLKIERITLNTRIASLQCIYSILFTDNNLTSQITKYFKTKSFLSESDEDLNKPTEINDKLFNYLVKGVVKNKEELDVTISKFLKISIEKNDKLLISLLRLGAFEILYRNSTADIIIISEYTKLADHFFPPAQVTFVNAILDKITKAKEIKK